MRTHFEPLGPLVRRRKPAQSTVELNPYTISLIGGPGLFDLVLDLGEESPVYVVRIPADLARLLRDKLSNKHIGETVV